MKTLLILFVCACATALSQKHTNVDDESSELRIIDGNNAKRHQFPYMVSIQYNGHHLHGASILSRTWLITSAHSLPYPDHKSLKHRAVAGLHKLGEIHQDIQSIPIVMIVFHPGYNPRLGYNDIALLKLASPLNFGEAVKPVMLPKPNENLTGEAIVSGWGLQSNYPLVPAFVLQYLEMDLITNQECNDILYNAPVTDTNYPFMVRNDKICTLPTEVAQNICFGDDGGPLVQNNVLVGIVHGGDYACGVNRNDPYPTIFTRVASFIEFINDHVQDLPKVIL